MSVTAVNRSFEISEELARLSHIVGEIESVVREFETRLVPVMSQPTSPNILPEHKVPSAPLAMELSSCAATLEVACRSMQVMLSRLEL